MNIQLDEHGKELLAQFKKKRPLLVKLEKKAYKIIQELLDEQGIYVTAIEHRTKQEKSLAGKLELKGAKYKSIENITDLVGLRIITFYTDDVDKIAAIINHTFIIDWSNSVDKRKAHQLNSFGYNSLHYICRLPKKMVKDEPELGEIWFELQMRTALQHAWSTIEHDTGYKSLVQIPSEYKRQFSRLAGMLELIDDEFSRLRTDIAEYNRQVQSLVKSGKLDEVVLSQDNFRNYLDTHPFERLNQRIAAVNQAEIIPTSLMPYFRVFTAFNFENIGDIERFIKENEEDAYQLAVSQLALTDLDIMAENVGVQNLCLVYALKNFGRPGLRLVFDKINGKDDSNEFLVDMIMEQAENLSFMHKKQ